VTWVLSLLSVLGVGCGEEDHFFPPEQFAMTSEMPPVAESERISYWQVEYGYELPLRDLTIKEQQRIEETYANPPAPYRRMPWIQVGDLDLEIEYTITNQTGVAADGMDDRYGYADNVPGVAVEVLMDGWTEFTEYVPGIIVQDEEATPNLSNVDDYVIVPNGGRVTGTIRMDQMQEAMYDLATILADPTEVNANCVVYFPNDHEDPARCQYAAVPDVVPGLVGFNIGMRTTEPADLALEFIVRVHDPNGKLWIDADMRDDERWTLPPRETFSPTPMGDYMM
jgi:hypothetical protein